jgi:hypothetical protein
MHNIVKFLLHFFDCLLWRFYFLLFNWFKIFWLFLTNINVNIINLPLRNLLIFSYRRVKLILTFGTTSSTLRSLRILTNSFLLSSFSLQFFS